MKEEKFTGKFKVGDKVYLLDGSKIQNFAGGWIPQSEMKECVGEIAEITGIDRISNGYYIEILKNGYSWTWDERAMSKEPSKKESIVIYNNGRVVTAINKNTKEKGIAKCNPKDEYDFETGAIIAFSRLILGFTVGDKVIGNDKNHYPITHKGWIGVVTSIRITSEFKYEIQVCKEGDNGNRLWVDCSCFDLYTESKNEIYNKKFNMKVVCTKECEGYTLGKIYEISDGKLIDDDGDVRPIGGVSKFNSLEDLNSGTAKFIKLVEE